MANSFHDSDQLFHFAHQVSAMNWYDADEYCLDQGGFLAEPVSLQDNEFLKRYARNFPNVNWWTALREGEDCQCVGRDARTTFDANIDYQTLSDPTNGNGFVRATCPRSFEKICTSQSVWFWSHGGVKMQFNDWNGGTNEPNGQTEHCMSLQEDEGYRFTEFFGI